MLKKFSNFIEESEKQHQNPYNIKDKDVIIQLLKKDLTSEELSTLNKVLAHIDEELKQNI